MRRPRAGPCRGCRGRRWPPCSDPRRRASRRERARAPLPPRGAAPVRTIACVRSTGETRDIMDAADARRIAMYTYLDERDRFGDPVIEHVARVAAAVAPEACATAWLHEVFEIGDTDARVLMEAGLGDEEFDALQLLTRSDDEVYEAHLLRIAHASGGAG